jgi:hypothetical protein
MTPKIIYILLFILCIFCIYLFYATTQDGMKDTTEIVIARYNENLEWMNNDTYKKYNSICYNSGKDNEFYKPDNMKDVKIENIGKEAYVYIYHIIKNYDNLAEVTVFLPGSCEADDRQIHLHNLFTTLETNKNTIFISNHLPDIKESLYGFQLDEWCSTNKNNFEINSECKLNASGIRPFGKWYESMFGDVKTTHVNYRGVLAVHKRHILQKDKAFYEKLLLEFNHPNDEIAHYFERSWEAIFYPMDDAIFLNF